MARAKISDFDWFDMWYNDKLSIISTMESNIQADLNAGYNPNGNSIIQQRNEIAKYSKKFGNQLDKFVNMTDSQVNRWCYFDLLKRGAITPINA